MKNLSVLYSLLTVSVSLANPVVSTRNADGNPLNQEMKIDFQIHNSGMESIVLAGGVLTYAFTEPTSNFASDVWWYSCGTLSDVAISVAATSASNARELHLNLLAGEIPAGGTCEIQMRLYKPDWSNFDETDDPSFVESSSFTINSSVALQQGTPLDVPEDDDADSANYDLAGIDR